MKSLLFLLFVALVAAQTRPTWPKAASTSVFAHGWSGPNERHFFRWFWDESVQKERVDGPRQFRGEEYWTMVILDAKAGKEWFVAYQVDLVTCFDGPTNHTLPHPNFQNARYVGKSMIDYEVCDHWIERLPDGRDGVAIFNRASTGEIVRMDFHDHRHGNRAVTFKFFEFNVGNQDPSLWKIPKAIESICNSVPFL